MRRPVWDERAQAGLSVTGSHAAELAAQVAVVREWPARWAFRLLHGYGGFLMASSGEYLFRAIKPVPYTGRCPHIHATVRVNGRELLTTQVYIMVPPGNEKGHALRDRKARDAVAVDIAPLAGARPGSSQRSGTSCSEQRQRTTSIRNTSTLHPSARFLRNAGPAMKNHFDVTSYEPQPAAFSSRRQPLALRARRDAARDVRCDDEQCTEGDFIIIPRGLRHCYDVAPEREGPAPHFQRARRTTRRRPGPSSRSQLCHVEHLTTGRHGA